MVESLMGIHRSISRLHESVGDEDVRRMVERQVEKGFDLSARAVKARYAELLLGLDSPAKKVSGWRNWRTVFTNGFVALDVFLNNFSVTPEAALLDDQVSFHKLVRGAIARTAGLGNFYHLQHENNFVSSAMYYSNAALKVAESMKAVNVYGGIQEPLARQAIRRSISEMANPVPFLQSVSVFYLGKIKLNEGRELLHEGLFASDVQRAFVIQHLLEDLINEIWKRDRNVVLRFDWNSKRGAIEIRVPSNKVTASIMEIGPRDLNMEFIIGGSVIRLPIKIAPRPSLPSNV